MKLLLWETAVFSKARHCCFYINLVQLNCVIQLMHLDLTAPDWLFSNSINYKKRNNNVVIDKKIKPDHSTGFHLKRNWELHTFMSWCYSSRALPKAFQTGKPRHWKAVIPVRGAMAIKCINFTGKANLPVHISHQEHHLCSVCCSWSDAPQQQYNITPQKPSPKNTPGNIPVFSTAPADCTLSSSQITLIYLFS